MAAPLKISFGGKLGKPSAKAPKASSAFADDDDAAAPPVASTSKPTQPIAAGSVQLGLSRQQKAAIAEAQQVDATAFEYDAVYDNMQAAKLATQAARKAESVDKKPKYIDGLMRTAEVRRTDRIRAEDKAAEREREAEGDEFDQKEAFVTAAYKAQQDVLRDAEEEEKRQEALNAGSKAGMAAFYKSYLQESEAAHDAAVKATAATNGPKPIFGPVRPPSPVLNEAAQAREAARRLGHQVQVNEDGEIVDKRELLAGGLNVTKPKFQGPSLIELAGLGKDAQTIALTVERRALEAAKAAGPITNADSARRGFLARQRQSEETQKQLLLHQAQKRKLDEDADRDVEARRLVKRNDESRVEALKRAAAERKRLREAEEAAANETQS